MAELAQWMAQMSGQTADYAMEGPHPAPLGENVQLPEEGVPLRALWWGGNGTLADAAAAYGLTPEELQRLNPGVTDEDLQREDGLFAYQELTLGESLRQFSDTQTVTIQTPWVQNEVQQSQTYEVPAALDEQAAAVMAEAYDFLWHLEVSTGYSPAEPVEGKVNLFRTVEGARFTRYSDFVSYLNAVFTPELAQTYASGAYFNEEWDFYLGGYMEGDNDALWQTAGDRGTNIYYAGTLFTEPETQPDGSVTFRQLSLQLDEETFAGWGGKDPLVPAFAEPSLVRLVPTENGWRVAQLSLPY